MNHPRCSFFGLRPKNEQHKIVKYHAAAGSMTTSLLELKNINTHYGLIHILQDVSLTINAGEIVCLLGGNACGKSTTLKTILVIVKPTSAM
jgi:ABC-type sugar transport system ATPase subunit